MISCAVSEGLMVMVLLTFEIVTVTTLRHSQIKRDEGYLRSPVVLMLIFVLMMAQVLMLIRVV